MQKVCGLLLNAILFKIRIKSGKINIAVKVFQRSMMICFECKKDVLDVFHKTTIVSKLKEGKIDKDRNLGFSVYDQGIVTYEQKKLRLSPQCNKHYVLTDVIMDALRVLITQNYFLRSFAFPSCLETSMFNEETKNMGIRVTVT